MRDSFTLASVLRRSSVSMPLAFVLGLLTFFHPEPSVAQQVAYAVVAADSSVSLYDLATSNLIEKINRGSGDRVVAVGANSRLAFVSCGSFISVIDLTIGREIQRIRNIFASPTGSSMFLTKDGKLLLVADLGNYTLDIIDAVTFHLIRQVNLRGAMGDGAFALASVVVVGNKAYVTTGQTDFTAPAIAVVDLTTFAAKAIAIPAGEIDFFEQGAVPDAAVTPDSRYLLMAQTNTNDFTYHLLFINTLTDKLVIDKPIPIEPQGLVVTSVANPATAFGYVVGGDTNGVLSATMIDLRPGSRTYGQILPSTEVSFGNVFTAGGVALSSDGTRLVLSAFHGDPQGPQPNAFTIDTSKMLADPTHAIIARTTVAEGSRVYGVSIGPVTVASPPTAPTVASVSGTITNNAATPIHVFGTNFASGAQVRIGSMANLPAIVNSSTDLQVTVPVNAPAAPNLDVVVTNPNPGSAPAQQNQSGVLAGGLTIFVNPAFQPHNQFAALNRADGSLAVFDFTQRAMINVPLASPAGFSLTFNFDGAELYSASNGLPYYPQTPEVVSLHLPMDSLTPVPLSGSTFHGYTAVAGARNPFTGNPGVIYAWDSTLGSQDIQVSMIDSNPSSPTFNQVIDTVFANLNADAYIPISGTATPDGKYVYVSYFDASKGGYSVAVFDIANGGAATILSLNELGASQNLLSMYVTPDGRSLLLNSATNGGIAVLDIGANPKSPTPVTTINGNFGHPFFLNYQVVGTRLFAFDVENNFLYAFNFDRQHSNFSRLGSYYVPGDYTNPYLAVSPDGNFLYLPFGGDDMISVFDANRLASGQQPLITNFASFHAPSVMAVSPVSH